MTLLRIEEIETNGNLRHTAASAEQDASLEASMRALGQLQPIIVRHVDGQGFVLVAGHRRLETMRRIGHDEIEAHVVHAGSQIAMAMQGAENLVRAGMDPVDQWITVRTLQEQGCELLQAGQMLGMSDNLTRRLHKLSGLAEPLLEALRGKPLPSGQTLGLIAAAPKKKQLEAFKRHRYAGDVVQWHSVAGECVVVRIPRARAIFDLETAGVLFEEDLFAEPGSEEQFTTDNVAGFMKAQDEAMQALIAAGTEPAMVGVCSRYQVIPEIPKGWTLYSTGASKALPKKGKRKRLYALVPATDPSYPGRVVSVVIEPLETTKSQIDPADAGDPELEGEVTNETAERRRLEAEQPEPESEVGPAITKLGQQLLAESRTTALRAALREPGIDIAGMLALIVLAFCSENISVTGGEEGTYDRRRHRDLAAALLTPAGDVDRSIGDDSLVRLAGEVMARTLVIRSAADKEHFYRGGSGDAAEWIGRALQADTCMPAIDTEALLACVGGKTLLEIAQQHDITGVKKTGELRKRLVGHAPSWNPIPFGAPAPKADPWEPVT